MKNKIVFSVYNFLGKVFLCAAGGIIGFILCPKASVVALGIGLGLVVSRLFNIDNIFKNKKRSESEFCN